MPNQLQREKSPYLLQHAGQPVNWQVWSPDVFQEARRLDRPVFLSIGYSTCHWCHVMARESFEDETVAEVLNRGFLNIKVDREERPDVDAVYMAACVALNGSGGWPLTALLTPEQKPFWVGTYLPKPQLLRLLEQALRLWRQDRGALLTAGDALTERLQPPDAEGEGASVQTLAALAAGQFAASYDPQRGGFGKAPKFPSPHNLLFLLHFGRLEKRDDCTAMALHTLDAMYRGGLYDHVGGGFCRYSTDADWLIPHFEKMLYDNALLSSAYLEAYRLTGRAIYAAVVRETLDYVLRELTGPNGGFFCAQDADSNGVEGQYYVWTPEEVQQLLGAEDAARFCRWYGITAAGNFGGRSVPNLLHNRDWEQRPAAIEALRRALARIRPVRAGLHTDDKVLTAWNGLMITAMARAGAVLSEPRYLAAARRAQAMIAGPLTGPGGRLFARWRDGDAAHRGTLDDYAFYAWSLLELYAVTWDSAFLEAAVRTASLLKEQFFDAACGGCYPYASDAEPLICRSKDAFDGAVPSGNAAAAMVFLRLERLTANPCWHSAAALQLQYLARAARPYPAAHTAGLLAMLSGRAEGGELLCVSAGTEPPGELLSLSVRRHPDLAVLFKCPRNAAHLAALAPFSAAYPIPDRGTRFYLCRGRACSPPADTPEQLEALLTAETHRS